MSNSVQIELEAAQEIRALLAFPVWFELWDDHLEPPQILLLDGKIERCLSERPNEVFVIVDAAQVRRVQLLAEHNIPSEAEFLLALASIRCCLEAAVFLDAVETSLAANIPQQHNLIVTAWKSYRQCYNDVRSEWPLNDGPLHFGPGWLAG